MFYKSYMHEIMLFYSLSKTVHFKALKINLKRLKINLGWVLDMKKCAPTFASH